jgi:hypothetical protein
MKRITISILVSMSVILSSCYKSLLPSSTENSPSDTVITHSSYPETQNTDVPTTSITQNTVFDVCPQMGEYHKNDLNGSVILYNMGVSYIVDLKSGSSISIGVPGDKFYYYTISPDQKRFFANGWREGNDQYSGLNILSNSNGVSINVTEISTEIFQWQNNDNVYSISYDEIVFPQALKITNLSDLSERNISLDFLSELRDININRWLITLSPTGEYIVYPDVFTLKGNSNKEWGVGFSLYNIQEKKVVSSLRDSSLIDFYARPNWTSDGSKFYIATSEDGNPYHDEIYSMNISGSIERLSNFTENHSFVSIRGLNLSPNEDKLAFWISLDPEKPLEEYLAILDINSEQTTRYCNNGNIDSAGTACYMGEPPFWSPDNTHIILTNCIAPNDIESINTKVIMIDLINNVQSVLVENEIVKGWLVNTHIK